MICVTGVPGTGKSVFASRLAEKLDYKYIDLNDFLIERGCVSEYDYRRETQIVDLDCGTKEVRNSFYRGDYILDSHVAHLVVPASIVTICFVLRLSPYLLMERLKTRCFGEEKVRENCAAEILDVITLEAKSRYGEDLVCELDGSRNLQETLTLAIEILRGERSRDLYTCDWLTMVSQRGDIDLFFD